MLIHSSGFLYTANSYEVCRKKISKIIIKIPSRCHQNAGNGLQESKFWGGMPPTPPLDGTQRAYGTLSPPLYKSLDPPMRKRPHIGGLTVLDTSRYLPAAGINQFRELSFADLVIVRQARAPSGFPTYQLRRASKCKQKIAGRIFAEDFSLPIDLNELITLQWHSVWI